MTTKEPRPQDVRAVPHSNESRYFNRELSWLAFNERVLEEALDQENPLLERLRFLSIFYSNLDEFFMIRVSGLQEQASSGMDVLSRDGLSPKAQLQRIQAALKPALQKAHETYDNSILSQLSGAGVLLVHYKELSTKDRKQWDNWYTCNVHPILTPLAVGPTQTFPFISNLSLNLALHVTSPEGETRLARVKIPPTLPRMVELEPRTAKEVQPLLCLMPIEELIAANIHSLFPGYRVHTPYTFRVTRDADIEIKEDEADDLLKMIQEQLQNRRFGRAVRLELHPAAPTSIRNDLTRGLGLEDADVYPMPRPVDTPAFQQLLSADLPEHKFAPHIGSVPESIQNEDLYTTLKNEDILLHHPFEAFSPMVEFIRSAARDPNVLAIKQTLYRTSGDSPVVHALKEAVNNGKQVAAVIELKARFDEANNITWARTLEQAGAHVIYGLPGLKVHSKMCLVIRNEGGSLKRYAHVSTGNYNPNTARLYTDFALFTANEKITADIADLFNRLTGFSKPAHYRCMLIAPGHLKRSIIDLIYKEATAAQAGEDSWIKIKCNAITDIDVIESLYSASQAGVKIDLFVRGICCLVPGRKGLSESITVRSVLGRFLEHSRAYCFYNSGDPKVYIGSSDLMDRNLKRRVEMLVPILDEQIKARVLDEILEVYRLDTLRTRLLQPDGSYVRPNGDYRLDAQLELISKARPKAGFTWPSGKQD